MGDGLQGRDRNQYTGDELNEGAVTETKKKYAKQFFQRLPELYAGEVTEKEIAEDMGVSQPYLHQLRQDKGFWRAWKQEYSTQLMELLPLVYETFKGKLSEDESDRQSVNIAKEIIKTLGLSEESNEQQKTFINIQRSGDVDVNEQDKTPDNADMPNFEELESNGQ